MEKIIFCHVYLCFRVIPFPLIHGCNPWHLQDGEAYAYLLNTLAPEHSSPDTLDAKDPTERANMILEQAEKLDCKRYLTPKDIVEGSPNLNLAFVAQIFQQRSARKKKNIFVWFFCFCIFYIVFSLLALPIAHIPTFLENQFILANILF